MNRRQLQKLGIPPACASVAIDAVRSAAEDKLGMGLKGKRARQLVAAVAEQPEN